MHLRHRWKLAAVQQGQLKLETGWVAGHFTWLLYQCEVCPACKVKKIDGHWKLEDFEEAE